MAITHVGSLFCFPSAALGAAVVLLIGATGISAQTPVNKDAAARERVLSPVVRDLRVGVAKAASTEGQVLVDARKLTPVAAGVAPKLVATDLAGNAVPMQWVEGATFAIKPDPKQWIVVRPATVTTEAMKRGVQWLPGVCVPPAAAPGAAQDVLSSYADFATVPVVWDTAIDAYRVLGNIGVAQNGDLAKSGPIGRTATVKMSFVGVSSAAPEELSITEMGIDGEREFSATFARTDTASPVLLVRSNLGGEQPYALEVHPRVELTPRRNPILGLGLDEVGVVLECVQAHGAPVALSVPSAVTLACSSGRDEGADALAVSAATPQAQFRFRSTWLGPAKIVATARTQSGAIVGSVVVQQEMPWPQFGAALVGGALGGFARRFVQGARRRSHGRRVVEGLVVGLIAFVAGVLGVGFLNLPPVIVATVAGAFLTGALAGFAGVVVLERFKVGGGTTKAD